MKPKFLIIEACDFEKYPLGGTLNFAKQMLGVFDDVALVGSTARPEDPIGQWFTRRINGREYPYFAYRRIPSSARRPLIPGRLATWAQFVRHRAALVQGSPSLRVFTRTPEILLGLNAPPWSDICFCFAGISNSVSISRYPMLRYFGGIYEKKLFRKLKQTTSVVLAAAARSAVAEACARNQNILGPEDIRFFPTRFDDRVFFPQEKRQCRRVLGLPETALCFAVSGRLSWVKGWRLVLDAFESLLRQSPDSRLVFVGDGEDRRAAEVAANNPVFRSQVIITGRQPQARVATWLNAADVAVVASHHEGWSTAMVEALACGKPVVSTDVSGAIEMIQEGRNGFVLADRNPSRMADAILRASSLPQAASTSLALAQDYALTNLRRDLENVWLNRNRQR